KRLVSGSMDKTLKVWNLPEPKAVRPEPVPLPPAGQATRTLQGHNILVWSVAFSPDGKRIVSGSFDQTVKVWDAQTGRQELTLRGHTQPVQSVIFTPDGKRIVSGSDDQTLKVWDTQTGQVERTLKGRSSFIRGVAISPDGMRIVSGCGQTPEVWNLQT